MSEPAWTTNPAPPPVDAEDAPTIDIEQPQGLLYHYTSPAGLVGIVNSRKGAAASQKLTFFASDVLQMNDRSELSFGLKLLREHFSSHAPAPGQEPFRQRWDRVLTDYLSAPTVEALERMHRPCVCAVSFTTDGSLLGQWVTYGSGGGFAIGLDARTLEESTYAGYDTARGENAEFRSRLFRVRYGEHARAHLSQQPTLTSAGMAALQTIAGLQDVVAGTPDISDRAMAAIAIAVACQLKDQAFSTEDEWRLLVGGGAHADFTPLLTGAIPPDFRMSGARMLAYRPVTVKPVDGGAVIRDLVVGPAADQAPLVHAAQQLLIANGHDPSVVRASKIPYRGW